MKKQKTKISKTTRKPDRVKIDGDWEEAMKTALDKKRPKEGWPKQPKSHRSDVSKDE